MNKQSRQNRFKSLFDFHFKNTLNKYRSGIYSYAEGMTRKAARNIARNLARNDMQIQVVTEPEISPDLTTDMPTV